MRAVQCSAAPFGVTLGKLQRCTATHEARDTLGLTYLFAYPSPRATTLSQANGGPTQRVPFFSQPLARPFDSQGLSSITNAHTTIQPHATSSLRCSQRLKRATASLSLRIQDCIFLTTQVPHMVIFKRPHCKVQVQQILQAKVKKRAVTML